MPILARQTGMGATGLVFPTDALVGPLGPYIWNILGKVSPSQYDAATITLAAQLQKASGGSMSAADALAMASGNQTSVLSLDNAMPSYLPPTSASDILQGPYDAALTGSPLPPPPSSWLAANWPLVAIAIGGLLLYKFA